MKALKKLLALTMALLMILSLSVNASAATTVTVNGGKENATYSAYELFVAKKIETDEPGTETTYEYTVNEKYKDILFEVTEETSVVGVLDALAAMEDNGDDIREFADAVYKAILKAEPELEADVTSTSNSFSLDDTGYYLIAETTETLEDGEEYSLVMLSTAGEDGDKTITAKEEIPKLDKKVDEKNDSTNETTPDQDAADYDIGDSVPFTLTGTVSDNYDSYETYYFAFHDDMSEGLTLESNSVKVYVDDTLITTGYTLKIDELTDSCDFEVIFDDLKTLKDSNDKALVSAGTKIKVEFTAKLGENAVIGSEGNTNEAKLEYSNNPYDEEDHGNTPGDKVIVITYELNVNKVDPDGEALEGATFKLQKYNGETTNWEDVGEEISGETTFTFTGLDEGKYKLVEVTAPDEYNKIEDIEFEIVSTFEEQNSVQTLTKLEVKDSAGNVLGSTETAPSGTAYTWEVELDADSISVDIVNNKGLELPETGGIGTTIFYIVGGLLTLAAVVLLVTKKKMSAAD